ncbi:hypothetical protein GUJ93_ZPchr0005g14576 [Zizania palustris]|uniref:phosphatidate phosphatase n=1 Tax=Zizania palustris TaxID=103762 RepID=A0A8J5T8U5_ZIZPA|nr:hypothetical protein GUJ93_ZPchr0005g14576 [Zizania palustris]
MNVVGRVGSLISQGVYSVATPFHPFGGAVDIIAVEQPDGSYRSTPWYVRFGKFQGVLKGAEKVVTITVNGVDANFHMLLDNSGQAYFMRELVPGSESSGTGSEEEEVSRVPEPPLRTKSDGELYIGKNVRPGSPELNVEHQEKQSVEEFDSYNYGSVDGHILTAPISSTEENMEGVQLSDPQFHLGPGQSSSGDFSRSGLEDLGDVPIEKDESHHVSVNGDELFHVTINQDETSAVLTNEDESLVVLESRNNDEDYQPLTNVDEAHDISGNKDEGYQPLPSKDEVHDVPENDYCYQPLATEDKASDVPLLENDATCEVPANIDKVCDVNNEDTELEIASPNFSKYDTFKSCLDLSSQMDDGDLGTEPFSPEFDHQRDSELSLSNHSIVDIDPEEDISKNTHHDQNDPLQYLEEEVDISAVTSGNKTESENSSAHYSEESDLSYVEGSHGKTKDIASSENKPDDLHSSIGSNDKDKLGSIPENPAAEEELNKEEHPQLQKGLGFEISLCGHLLRPGMGLTPAEEVFQQHLVLEDAFKLSGPSIIKNANLVVKIDSKYFLWSKASHVVLGKTVFGLNFCAERIDAIPVEHQGTPSSREDSLGLSPSSRRWRLWPIPFRISRSLQRSNSDSSEDIFLDTESVLSPMDEQDPENDKNQSPRKQFVRTLIPSSEQVASLNLKEGQNIVTFSFSTRVLGKQQVEAHIYLWKWNAKLSYLMWMEPLQGKVWSDVLGQVMPLVGRDWSQSGVARLFSAIKENGYQLLFLSARAIVQAYLTKNFLFNLKQDGKVLPNGPVVISPDGLFPSLYREVIRRAPHEFKIACLEDIKALFPSDYNPFYAGFGNRDTDELSYKKMGIPKGKIFIINPKGEVAINSSVDVKSYTSLHTLVHDMFPPTTLVEQEDYNSWNYWRMPLPDVDL